MSCQKLQHNVEVGVTIHFCSVIKAHLHNRFSSSAVFLAFRANFCSFLTPGLEVYCTVGNVGLITLGPLTTQHSYEWFECLRSLIIKDPTSSQLWDAAY